MQCQWTEAWVGQCENEAVRDGYCEEHVGEMCVSCGEQATHSCSETMGLVCGAPLCDNCEHTIRENGCNSGAPLPEGLDAHCRKDEQVYESWWKQEN